MNRLFYLLLFVFLISSCGNEKTRLANEKTINGDWVQVQSKSYGGELSSKFYDLSATGFSFYSDHTYDNKAGFFKQIKDDKWGRQNYLGSTSIFRLSEDSLYLFRPDNNKWHAYKIFELTPTSLKFGINDVASSFVRINIPKTKTPGFDKIVLSTSPCMLPCPVTSTIINSNGSVLFGGLKFTTPTGLYNGVISREKYRQLQDNFRKADFNSLKSFYDDGPTDQRTISVTFIKNGRIYKSVSDYADGAPEVFRWAYVPLENLYQQIPLKSILSPQNIPYFNSMLNATFTRGGMALRLTQSETFLLMDYLRNGKICNKKFVPRFKMHGSFEINKFPGADTDGRYYTFVENEKPVTIDIGFNFYDVNAKIWQWRKAEDYD